MKTIKIKLLRGMNTVSPQENSDWIDLRAAEETKLAAGERICQFRIIKHQPAYRLKWVETLKGRNRGGIGSTGRV